MTNNTKITQDLLLELIDYNKDTGIFRWKARNASLFSHCKYPDSYCSAWNTKFSGCVCGSVVKLGKINKEYVQITITIKGNRINYLAHRLAFLFVTGHFPIYEADHIDHNGLNNIWSNLRDTCDNNKNLSIRKSNTSGFTGVYYSKARCKWFARVSVDGEEITGSYFTDKVSAVKERKTMNSKYGFHKNHGK